MPHYLNQAAPQIAAALHISGDRWALAGPVTFETVASLEKALDATRATPQRLSLQDVTEVDSSAVAFLVAVKRRHQGVQFDEVPAALDTLAELYGVRDILTTQ